MEDEKLKLLLLPILLVGNVFLWQWGSVNCPLFQPFWVITADFLSFNLVGVMGLFISSVCWLSFLFGTPEKEES